MAVNPDMVAVALGRTVSPSDPEYDQWAMWIGDAEMLIQARKTELGITDPLNEATYDYVVREAVVQQVRRPDDASQVTVSIQDASTSRSYSSSKGRVFILDEWWVLLGLTSPSGGAFAIDTFAPSAIHYEWCSYYFGSSCTCGAGPSGYPYVGYQYPLYVSET